MIDFKITEEKIKELKTLLWILDSKHNVSVPQTQENINYISDEIVKLFSIPDVVSMSKCCNVDCNDLTEVDSVYCEFHGSM